jgi:hypothetical protein
MGFMAYGWDELVLGGVGLGRVGSLHLVSFLPQMNTDERR